MALEDLEKNLYQKKEIREPTAPVEKKTFEEKISSGWAEKEKIPEKNILLEEKISKISVFSRRFFWMAIVLVLIAIGFLIFYLYQFFASKDIIFTAETQKEVQIGVPFPLKINFQNTSESDLKEAKISIDLPDNVVAKGGNPSERILSEDLGDLVAGSFFEKEFSFIALADENSAKRFNILLSYYPPNIKNRFEKNTAADINVKESAIRFNLATPVKVLNSEEFEINIDYENVSDFDFIGAELELKYPQNFTFKGASTSSVDSINLWNLGDLKKGDKGDLTVSGTVYGQENSSFNIEGIISAKINAQKYIINKKISNINIAPSPLALNFIINNQSSYVASLGEDLKYEINYKNNTDTALKDVILKVSLKGAMFDFTAPKTSGTFNSKDNSIAWTATNISGFSYLMPGAGGTVDFTIKTKSSYPIKKISDKNFVLKAHAEITSPTTPYYVSAEKTIGVADFDVEVSGLVQIDSQALFNDSQSGFVNSGWPLKVNKSTKFTIHWIIKNYSTDIENIKVKGVLAGGVKWLNKVKSNVSSVPTYNERTQEINWIIDEILATKGVVSKAVEAIFQVEAVPNTTQIENYMPLLSETTISATDVFNNLILQNKDSALTSDLADDPYVNRIDGKVKP